MRSPANWCCSKGHARFSWPRTAGAPMHPADEFEAFMPWVDEGKGIEDVAVPFGVSLLTVQHRLKLAALMSRRVDKHLDARRIA